MAKDTLLIEAQLDIPQTVINVNKQLKQIKKQIKKLQIEATIDNAKLRSNIKQDLAKLKSKEKELKIKLKPQTDELRNKLKNIKKNSDIKLNYDTKSATNSVTKFKDALCDSNTSATTLGAALKNALNSVGIYTTAYQALAMVRTMANEAKAAVEEYDKYTTNIKTIIGADDTQTQQMLSDYSDIALNLRVDISDIAGANEVILRAGKAAAESKDYLNAAVKLAKSGFIDTNEAAENLIVIGNAYNITADKLQGITDTLLYLDSNANVTAGELSKAVATAAKTSDMANISYSKLASMISTVVNDTGKTENEAATALNRVLSRAYNVKLNNYLQEAETEGATEQETITAINDLEKILSTLDVKVRDSKDEFRDFTDIIDDLAPKFDKLSSVEQSAVTFALGGAQYKNTVKALIDDWDSVIKLENQAANAIGVTDSKYTAYLDSIEASNATIETSLKNLWNDLLPADNLKNIKDATVNIIEFTDKYQILQTLIRGATLFALAKGFIFVKNGISGTIANLSNFNTATKIATTSSSMTEQQIKALGTACKGLSDKQLIAVLSTDNLTNAERIAALQAMGMSEAEAVAKLETLGLSTAETTAATATTSLKRALGGLWATISANPIGLIITGITAAISVFTIFKQKSEEAAEAAKQAKEEQKQTLDQAVNTATAEKDNIRELISQYEAFRDVTSLTADDKATLKTIQDKLIETFNLEAGAIDLVNSKYDDMIGKVKELSYQQLKQNENTLIAAKQAAKDSYNTNRQNNFNITTNEKSKKKEDIYYNYVLNALEQMGLLTESFGKNGKQVSISSDLDSGAKVANIRSALELFKTYDLTDTELFQWLTELQNYYQDEVDSLETATQNYAETVVDLYNYKNNIAPDTLSATQYMQYVDDLLATIPETDKELQAAVKSVTDAMHSPIKVSGDSALTNLIDAETDAFEKYKDTISSYLSEKSKLESALKEQHEKGYITIDTAFSLSDMGYGSAVIKDESGNYRLLADEIYKTVDAKNAEAVATLQLAKAQKIAAKEAEIADYKVKLSRHIENGSTALLYQQQIKQLQKDIQDTIDNYDMLISFYAVPELVIDDDYVEEQAEQAAENTKDIVNNAFKEAKSNIDHLLAMDVITEDEYYESLLELVDNYYKDKEDFLDEYRDYEEKIYSYLKQKQIDNIQEQIDALKAVNEEKQEEIDLEEKRQALENAKNQKTLRVYDSERGWINETNKEDVKSAQKDYDDALLDKQVSELESLKEAIENGKNTAHSETQNVDIKSQVESLLPADKPINTLAELFDAINIAYNPQKLQGKAWSDMTYNLTANDDYKPLPKNNDIISNTSSNVTNINNNNQVYINVEKVVADNPQQFLLAMEQVVDDKFPGLFADQMNQFGRKLKLYKSNHANL